MLLYWILVGMCGMDGYKYATKLRAATVVREEIGAVTLVQLLEGKSSFNKRILVSITSLIII